MFILKNKLVSALIAINIIFFMIIYSLLVKDNKTVRNVIVNHSNQSQPASEISTVTAAQTATMPESITTIEVAPEKTETISQSIQRVVNADIETSESMAAIKPENQKKTNSVDVYYDGNIVRMEEEDNQGNRHITISNSLDDIGKLTENDRDYVNALNRLKQGNLPHVSFTTTSQMTAKSQAVKAKSPEKPIDYFNKVDVSSQAVQTVEAKMTLAQKIESALADEENTSTGTLNSTKPPESDAYLATLETASKERVNEMRTIKVRRGDTLWVIARRAYGSGFQYPKIYKANPHLTNPNKITVGDILRVPL